MKDWFDGMQRAHRDFNAAMARRIGAMTEQLRCTCGAWEKVEKALERIMRTAPEYHRKLLWDWENGHLRRYNDPADAANSVKCFSVCELASGVVKLADLHDPPKPKEREWRVGDELKDTWDVRWLIVASIEEGWKVSRIGTREEKNIRDGRVWSNLTIEAEKVGEK